MPSVPSNSKVVSPAARYEPYARIGKGFKALNFGHRCHSGALTNNAEDSVAQPRLKFRCFVSPQLPTGDPDLDRGYRHTVETDCIPHREGPSFCADDLEQWLRGVIARSTIVIPKWKIHSEVAVTSSFADYVEACLTAAPSQFRPEEFIRPSAVAQRFVLAQVLAAYAAIGSYVPKFIHPDLTTLFRKYDGQEVLDLLEEVGVDNLHKFSIMSILFNQRVDTYIPILLLAMGFGAETSSSSRTLIVLMQRVFCHATNNLGHKSLTARIIFQTELQERMQRFLWEMERDSPMPQYRNDLCDDVSRRFEEIVKDKINSLPPRASEKSSCTAA
ncbi:hypothetical protein CYLTODRAFT_460210 [Cylindrobasidium torrendii FP15055 ss-10]|uniref:Uncharacterized protein n=1 Tax=Cylindrobasidium torrendii FP15055 ss-10 TaxID=1314674 RepID=A0A0D7ASL7_9AGAR|nr:hypothetical protein CYLTODRAFT_460210 [Cylindrobasidium torrendii FP15055 ss-10]